MTGSQPAQRSGKQTSKQPRFTAVPFRMLQEQKKRADRCLRRQSAPEKVAFKLCHPGEVRLCQGERLNAFQVGERDKQRELQELGGQDMKAGSCALPVCLGTQGY